MTDSDEKRTRSNTNGSGQYARMPVWQNFQSLKLGPCNQWYTLNTPRGNPILECLTVEWV